MWPFESSALEEIPGGLRRNIFRKAMEILRPNMRNLDFNTLERASDFVDAGTQARLPKLNPRQVDLIEGLTLYREGDAIYLAALEADLPSCALAADGRRCASCRSTGQVNLNMDFTLSASEVDIETARNLPMKMKIPLPPGWMPI